MYAFYVHSYGVFETRTTTYLIHGLRRIGRLTFGRLYTTLTAPTGRSQVSEWRMAHQVIIAARESSIPQQLIE